MFTVTTTSKSRSAIRSLGPRHTPQPGAPPQRDTSPALPATRRTSPAGPTAAKRHVARPCTRHRRTRIRDTEHFTAGRPPGRADLVVHAVRPPRGDRLPGGLQPTSHAASGQSDPACANGLRSPATSALGRACPNQLAVRRVGASRRLHNSPTPTPASDSDSDSDGSVAHTAAPAAGERPRITASTSERFTPRPRRMPGTHRGVRLARSGNRCPRRRASRPVLCVWCGRPPGR
jgi:hypothetical protein